MIPGPAKSSSFSPDYHLPILKGEIDDAIMVESDTTISELEDTSIQLGASA